MGCLSRACILDNITACILDNIIVSMLNFLNLITKLWLYKGMYKRLSLSLGNICFKGLWDYDVSQPILQFQEKNRDKANVGMIWVKGIHCTFHAVLF